MPHVPPGIAVGEHQVRTWPGKPRAKSNSDCHGQSVPNNDEDQGGKSQSIKDDVTSDVNQDSSRNDNGSEDQGGKSQSIKDDVASDVNQDSSRKDNGEDGFSMRFDFSSFCSAMGVNWIQIQSRTVLYDLSPLTRAHSAHESYR
jgi:hypothetical protein